MIRATMDEDEARKILREAIYRSGGQTAFAKKHGFTAGYVHDVLVGKRAIADRIACAIGLKREVAYTVDRREIDQ